MKTLILYLSKHGTTEKVARMIQSGLADEVTIVHLKQNRKPDLTSFQRVIIGTSVYAGTPSKSLMKFCLANLKELQTKELGLFVCGMEPDKDKQQKELANAFPAELVQIAKASVFAGGEFLFEKMNFFERMVIKKIAKTSVSISRIDESSVKSFLKTFA